MPNVIFVDKPSIKSHAPLKIFQTTPHYPNKCIAIGHGIIITAKPLVFLRIMNKKISGKTYILVIV
ncbi:hypothetical protein A4D02_08040 [Niastella koreensis]|uniref:Uncharacterized protein n=1 Tax=Niastella koreensis TaxID=354356 RepID=A0ABX3NXS3_9BACT|nr:hypothetical protein A4D02_08040 [Niastella koreensis]